MYKILLFIIILINVTVKGNSQTTIWAERAGGNYYDYIYQMVNDVNGNLYVLGEHSANSEFGNITVANQGQFLAKLDTNGNFLFVIEFDSIIARTIAINSSNQILLVGAASGSDVDGTAVSVPPGAFSSVGFAALYDTSGTQLWLSQFDNYGFFSFPVVTFGAEFVISGFLPPNGSIGAFTFSNALPYTFITTINTSGVFTDASLIASNDYGTIIVSDTTGNIYLKGNYYYSVSFANGQTLSPNYGNEGYYILKCDPSLNIVWSIHGQGFSEVNEFGSVSSMTILSDQNLVVTGSFTDSTHFGNDTIINSSVNNYTTFVIAIDPAANTQWVSLSSVDGPVLVKSLDNTGFYLTGTPMATSSFIIDGLPLSALPNHVAMYMVKFDNSGNPLWGKVISSIHMGGHCCESITSIVKGNGDALFLAGFYYVEAIFDTITLPCYLNVSTCGPYDTFVAKLENIPSGIVSLTVSEEIFSIYPNPTSGLVKIEAIDNKIDHFNTNIFDLSGRLIFQQKFNNEKVEINLNKLKDGIYFLENIYDEKIFRKKIVKVTTE